MSFGEVLEGLRSSCPKARATAIVDHDGIPVASSPRDPVLETLCAEFAAILSEVRQAGREFHHGVLKQFSVFGEDVTSS
jgi:predicted regulator of Ras-like GTPase activity (Roadblock/LC7/MglB family)